MFIDIETFAETDLTTEGLDRYAADPTLEILMASWFHQGELVTWSQPDPVPAVLLGLLADPDVLVHGWNVRFERACIAAAWGVEIPWRRCRCDMAQALSLGLPGSLGAAGAALGLSADQAKKRTGRTLIRKFCQPRRPTKNKPWTRCNWETDPENWAEFVDYNRQDVRAEMTIHRKLARWPVPVFEWRHWCEDARVNDAGLPIDRTLVDQAILIDQRNHDRLIEEAQAITGLANPNSVAQLSDWLRRQGVATESLTKHQVQTLLDAGQTPEVERVLQIRQELGKTSVKKFHALARATGRDGRLRNSLQFYGAARTGRWAGRIFQPQNLPRGNINDPEALRETVERIRAGGEATPDELSSVIRCAVRAPDGRLLRVADLANIESRILGWLADSRRMLRVFADPEGDIYKDFAVELFQCRPDEVDKARRNYAKPPTLGCGYGLGADGLVKYAEGYFVDMTKDEAQTAVDTFRQTYPEVPALWRRLTAATVGLVRAGKGRRVVGRLRFEYDAPFLFMILPSGRRLAYLQPTIEERKAPWGDMVPNVTYMGLDQYTRQWVRLSTHGGKWVEQACQAISRDLLALGVSQALAAGFEVVGHTHDELIALSGADDWLDHDVLAWCMTRPPPWGDAKLYLGAAGFSDVIYRKD